MAFLGRTLSDRHSARLLDSCVVAPGAVALIRHDVVLYWTKIALIARYAVVLLDRSLSAAELVSLWAPLIGRWQTMVERAGVPKKGTGMPCRSNRSETMPSRPPWRTKSMMRRAVRCPSESSPP